MKHMKYNLSLTRNATIYSLHPHWEVFLVFNHRGRGEGNATLCIILRMAEIERKGRWYE
jgi:hypothetical protein